MRGVALVAAALSDGLAAAADTNAASANNSPQPADFLKRTYCYKQVSGCKIHADIYRLDDARNRPAIVWIHGGALISGNRANLHPLQLEKYLDVGFNVISIDYRLAPETKLKFILEDLRDAFGWVRTQGPSLAGIDRDRVAVVGHSAGGYLALMSGVCVKPRPEGHCCILRLR